VKIIEEMDERYSSRLKCRRVPKLVHLFSAS